MLQQILQGQAAGALDVAKKLGEVKTQIDFTYTDLNNKIESMNSRIKCLENSSASTSAPKPMGQLPGKAIQNPKDFCNAILSRESGSLHDHEVDVQEIEALLYGSDTKDDSVIVTEDSEVSDGEDLLQVQAEKPEEIAPLDQTAQVQAARVTLTRASTRPTLVESNSKTHFLLTDSAVSGRVADRANTTHAAKLVISEEKKVPYVPPPYKPTLPFPGRVLLQQYRELMDKRKREAEMRDAVNKKKKESQGIEAPPEESDAIIQKKNAQEKQGDTGPPTPQKVDTKAESKGTVVCTTKIEPKSLPKLGNPGMFTIACSLGNLEIKDALCDSGASVNVMSYEMCKSLGIRNISEHPSSIVFGNSQTQKPSGLLADYPLKIRGCVIPTDFVIVEMQQANRFPLILGTPFLNTTGATMDFKNQRAVLQNVDDRVYYPLNTLPSRAHAQHEKSPKQRDRTKSATNESEVDILMLGQLATEEISGPLYQPP